jgi:hypothetical protein
MIDFVSETVFRAACRPAELTVRMRCLMRGFAGCFNIVGNPSFFA